VARRTAARGGCDRFCGRLPGGCLAGDCNGPGHGGLAGLAGAGFTGAGAGWADAADEMTSEAAMVAIKTCVGEGIGINVTGSEKEGSRNVYNF